ncbi:TRAP transporter small permease [Ferrovibrio sp.]|uniref:TRAP transporter small permease n=1 Tax=Ferrovibrio sp. TaxID=1917215 RepID=UPI0025C05075|nr:TRAP transporter small permease [Ferrovibrio sp.]MBX3455369.1 TRAP transporter small permease [Ferrovibrio sp.]
MKIIDRIVTGLANLAGKLAGLVALICLALVGAGVAMRYFVNMPQSWIDETATWTVIAMVMLAAPMAQLRDDHIGVDALVLRFGPRGRRLLAIFSALSVAAVGALMLWAGIETVSFSQMIGIMAQTLAWMPMWIVQSLLPIGGGLLLLTALAQLLKILQPGWVPPKTDDPIHGTRSHE